MDLGQLGFIALSSLASLSSSPPARRRLAFLTLSLPFYRSLLMHRRDAQRPPSTFSRR
jgi:hypothetical protein